MELHQRGSILLWLFGPLHQPATCRSQTPVGPRSGTARTEYGGTQLSSWLLSAQSVGPRRSSNLLGEGFVLSHLSSGNARTLYRQNRPGVRLRKRGKQKHRSVHFGLAQDSGPPEGLPGFSRLQPDCLAQLCCTGLSHGLTSPHRQCQQPDSLGCGPQNTLSLLTFPYAAI